MLDSHSRIRRIGRNDGEKAYHRITHTHINTKNQFPPELLSKVPNTSLVCDLIQKCQLDPSDKSKELNMLSKTNNVTHTKDIDLLNQEN